MKIDKRKRSFLFRSGLFCLLLLLFYNLSACSDAEKKPEDRKEEQTESVFFTGIRDRYVCIGESIDYLYGVSAFSETGENCTEDICVDASGVVLDVKGEYELTYWMEAEDGKRIEEKCRIFVNTKEENMEQVLKDKKPSLVAIQSQIPTGTERGSGFLIDENENEFFIMTNAHVVEEARQVQIFLFDGTKVTGKVSAKKESPDMAIVTIPKSAISKETQKYLQPVSLYQQAVEEQDNRLVGYLCLKEDGTIRFQRVGNVISWQEELWAVEYPVVEYTCVNEFGASGSAVFDCYGDLVAMVLGTSREEENQYWGIRVQSLLAFWQEVTGCNKE